MKREIITAGGHSTASPLRSVLRAPFTRGAWAEVRYALATLPLALAAVAFIVPMLANGLLWAASAPGVRKFGAASRSFARGLLRVRVTDDGRGGARPVPGGGLRGLAGRVGTVDGRPESPTSRSSPTRSPGSRPAAPRSIPKLSAAC